MSATLEAALVYGLEYGWAPLPTVPGGKAPDAHRIRSTRGSPGWTQVAKRHADEAELAA